MLAAVNLKRSTRRWRSYLVEKRGRGVDRRRLRYFVAIDEIPVVIIARRCR